MWILLKAYASNVWKYILPMIKAFLSAEYAVILKSVLKAMEESKNSTGTPQEKRDMIFNMVVKDLLSQGAAISYSLIYAAIRGVVKQ